MTITRSICILLTLTMLAGCTSFQPLYPAPDIIASQLQEGDFVRVATRSGDLLKFRVDTITDEGFDGGELTLAFEEIAQIEVRRWDSVETFWLLGGIAVGVGILWAAAIVSSGIGFPD